MKKILSFSLTICMLLTTICSCTQPNNYEGTNDNYYNEDHNEESNNEEPKIVNLTVDNIDEYIVFSTTLSDTSIQEFNIDNVERCSGKLTVKTASKQNVEYSNLKICFKVVADSSSAKYGWETVYSNKSPLREFNGVLNITYNGIWEESFNIISGWAIVASEEPEFSIVVTEVSGTATFN